MLAQLVLADEGLVADVAGMRPLPGMDGLHVTLEVVRAREVLAAQVAGVGLDAAVRGDVALEVDVLGKVLTAGRAGEGPGSFVATHVNL